MSFLVAFNRILLMSWKRITTFIATFALLAGVFPSQYALAQSPEIKAARSSVLSTTAAPVETVEKSQKAIMSVLDLTATELADLLSDPKLGAVIGGSDAGLASSARDLKKRLTMYQNYVGALRRQVLHAGQSVKMLGLVAADLNLWRERVYNPAIRQAFNVVLVAQGNDVLLTALRRLERVTSDVKKLQISHGTAANPLLPPFEKAKDHLASATKYQDEARALFVSESEEFSAISYGSIPGGPSEVVLSRGSEGDFACLPQAVATRTARCQIAFKLAQGGYYLLQSADGTVPAYAPSDVSKVSGLLILIEPIFVGDLVVGLMFIDSVNVAQPKEAEPDVEVDEIEGAASALDTIVPAAPTVQSLIKLELDEINKAYQQGFFVMSKLAKKLLSQ